MIHESKSSYSINNKKSVRFSSVTIREYPMILGDHPDVTSGPPIAIDWYHEQEQVVSIDHHIDMTPLPRRDVRQMVMPAFIRTSICINAGCTDCEMLERMQQNDIIREQRNITVRSLNSLINDEIKEKVIKKLKKVLSRTKRLRISLTKNGNFIPQ